MTEQIDPEGQVSPAAVDETCQGAVGHLWGLGPSAARAGVKLQPQVPGRWAPSTGVWLPVGSSIPTPVLLWAGLAIPPPPAFPGGSWPGKAAQAGREPSRTQTWGPCSSEAPNKAQSGGPCGPCSLASWPRAPSPDTILATTPGP